MTAGLSTPWKVIEAGECFIVTNAGETVRIAYLYFEDENPTRRFDTKRMTKDEAKEVASMIAGLGVETED